MKTIINCETGEVLTRELNDEELAQEVIDNKRAEAEAKKIDTANKAKAKAKAELLERLGITEDEAKLLLS